MRPSHNYTTLCLGTELRLSGALLVLHHEALGLILSVVQTKHGGAHCDHGTSDMEGQEFNVIFGCIVSLKLA